jgi:hypothetical protein
LYSLLCGCALFGVFTHYWAALRPAEKTGWVWQDTSRRSVWERAIDTGFAWVRERRSARW